MLLIDTSVWITVLRDRSGELRQKLEKVIDSRTVVITRFTQLELLQGSLNEQEWSLLSAYLEAQIYVELTSASWQSAARIYYDLRRQGLTVRSPIDCCIAQAALENGCTLVHRDRDFDAISQVRPLQALYFPIEGDAA
jgi:predicted nucleic acid-binding protein